jgi:hypothetical protein
MPEERKKNRKNNDDPKSNVKDIKKTNSAYLSE